MTRQGKDSAMKRSIGCCVVPGCWAPAALDYARCPKHLIEERERSRRRQGCEAWRPGSCGRRPVIAGSVEQGAGSKEEGASGM